MSDTPSQALTIIILAAGSGTRMKSSLPKVLHPIAHLPMIGHVLATAKSLKPAQIIVVVGTDEGAKAIREYVTDCDIAVQEKPLGTGHAVRAALPAIKNKNGRILVLYGDGPLYTKTTLQSHLATLDTGKGNALSFLGMRAVNPHGYGRMILDHNGHLVRIVEEREATDEERTIDLCWSGVMCAKGTSFSAWVSAIKNENSKGEYYLTSLPEIAHSDNVETHISLCAEVESLGANTRAELSALEAKYQARKRIEVMESGVTIQAPETVFFSHDTQIGEDCVIEPHVVFGPNVSVGAGSTIKAFSHLEGARLGKETVIGPYARLRPGAELGDQVKIGNFVEVKNAKMGTGSKANHLAYIGDAKVGAGANIGAGTITCNYDGFKKHLTEIGEGSFIGSNSTLVAPVAIGNGAYVAAGSVITEGVPDDALAVARNRPILKDGWAAKQRAAKSTK
ncbi:MAG: bifunctional UDP-N-acetylglucosamine diphosphorylase/glucosamine-1-phosphate N-acetyltransferase GlmU [Pseudobdellovibrionaceae bacterium]